MRHFLTTADWSRDTLQSLLDAAGRLQASPVNNRLAGRTIALVFLNPSMRTRTSFEVGAFQLGAHAVVLEPGKGAWGIEFDAGAVTDGAAEEHVAEVAAVLSRFGDFRVDSDKMGLTNRACFSHCLPLRRNVKATDAVMDADYCVAVDEAENRMHVQKALMMSLLGEAS